MSDVGKVPVITIDGPAGAGKSSVAVLLARRLRYHLLVSGALYRTLALQAIDKRLDIKDREGLLDLVAKMRIGFFLDGEVIRVRLNGVDVTDLLGREDCASFASRIAEIPELRGRLLEYQHTFIRLPGLVAEGRDMGTVVFPKARVKVFLTADLEERVRRRRKQLNDSGLNVSLARLRSQMHIRDKRDGNRCIAPLKPADDAVLIDTTKKSIGMVVEEIENLVVMNNA